MLYFTEMLKIVKINDKLNHWNYLKDKDFQYCLKMSAKILHVLHMHFFERSINIEPIFSN